MGWKEKGNTLMTACGRQWTAIIGTFIENQCRQLHLKADD